MESTSPDYSTQLQTIIDQQAQILEWFQRFYEIGQQMTPVVIGVGLGILTIGAMWYWSLRGV